MSTFIFLLYDKPINHRLLALQGIYIIHTLKSTTNEDKLEIKTLIIILKNISFINENLFLTFFLNKIFKITF